MMFKRLVGRFREVEWLEILSRGNHIIKVKYMCFKVKIRTKINFKICDY
jgi:hypothetical protein